MVSITFQPTTEDIILFVGGGEVAERRMQLFIEEPCQIVVIRLANGQRKIASLGVIGLSQWTTKSILFRVVCCLSAQIIMN